MEKQDEIKRTLRIAAMIGVAVLASLFIYLVIEEILRMKLHPFRGFAAGRELSGLRYVFWAFAVAEVLFIRVLQSLLLRRAPGDDFKAVLQKLLKSSITTICLSEVPAVIGFVLFLLRGLNIDFYALLAVSIILVFMYFPRLSSWEDWISRNA